MILPLDRDWNFRRLPSTGGWERVELPHTPFVADLDGTEHWFGECEYQRTVQLPAGVPLGRCALHVGAAMHSAVVLVDGAIVGRHEGGYLPFEVDLTAALRDGLPHALMLRLDNRDNGDVPPGKPYLDLDFCWYGGLYREAELRCHPPLHITDPVSAAVTAGGGVFVRTLTASPESARLNIKTHVRNVAPADQRFDLVAEVLSGPRSVAKVTRRDVVVAAGASLSVETELDIARPALWQPDSPALHDVRVTLRSRDDIPLDERTVRFGIRRIHFSRSGGFVLNGRRLRLRGTNRHQEYPRVGYAVPAAAQRRDARRIKEAGFDYVRLSHYPQSPDFLDACDELGLVVMNCIPGWQFIGGERFRENSFQNARDMIRRDRNHPCVVLWELSLNETDMDEAFMDRMHAIGHEEYPGDQMFTCGWMDRYDVFIHSRQHGKIHTWQNGDKALVIAEYGDWEFYAANEGFDQKTGAGIYDASVHGRQLRRAGERGLLRQALNHIIALNDTLSSPAAFDGQWSMFDYARGYDPNRAACGIMDIFRLPKFSWWFYRSQRDAGESGAGWTGGPVVFIASHWSPASDLRVRVFTNCDEVALSLNGVLIDRQRATRPAATASLPHSPMEFQIPAFTRGTLEATGYLGGAAVCSHQVTTPNLPAHLMLEIDTAGVIAPATEPDVLIAHARIVDAGGNLCVGDSSDVAFTVEGDAEIVGPASGPAEAGIASIVLRLPPAAGEFRLHATRPDGAFVATYEWSHPSVVTQANQAPANGVMSPSFK
ncbi:MAG TPA: glycoside hydrolase family 2 TIM barrel-domain containing protein [Lacunisphaera sp.]|nr:glycoside hydrolase family 2 TIM barrel-domain containing protein [Lacunisphaera sp.]